MSKNKKTNIIDDETADSQDKTKNRRSRISYGYYFSGWNIMILQMISIFLF